MKITPHKCEACNPIHGKPHGVRVEDGVRFVHHALSWDSDEVSNEKFSADASVYRDGDKWSAAVSGSDGADWYRSWPTFREALKGAVNGMRYILDGSPEA